MKKIARLEGAIKKAKHTPSAKTDKKKSIQKKNKK
jgi:hypothetical protein